MSVDVVYDRELAQDKDFSQLDQRVQKAARQLASWVNQARATTNRSSMFDRAAYAAPDDHIEQMLMARKAVRNDDVVGGIAEVQEGMAFDGVKWESSEPDETDVFNQMAGEQNLDAVVRKMHRECYTYSQAVLGFWWDEGEFTVRGDTVGGNKRRKSYRVWYPKAITVLDSTRVVPVGMLQFGQELLAWNADPREYEMYDRVQQGLVQDELMERFYSGAYIPTDPVEIEELTALKVDISKLVLLSDELVKRHTLTKPDFARYPDIRMARVFKLLDLKQQLMEADRITLIGAANYILLVKKGDKDDPAYPEEIANLRENFDYVAKLPVIFADHRLSIEIITPKQDNVLNTERYDVLDNRIAATCLGLFGAVGSRSGNRGDTSLSESRLVAKSLQNQRHMIRRFLERHLARAVVDHPRNRGVFESEPNLAFVPNRIQLDDDQGFAQSIIQLRSMNELSRESALEYFGFDQAVEAMRRTLEADSGLDNTFQTMVPFSSPEQGNPGAANARSQPPAAQGVNGARGGRPAGGGTPSRNPTKAPAQTKSGQSSPKKGS